MQDSTRYTPVKVLNQQARVVRMGTEARPQLSTPKTAQLRFWVESMQVYSQASLVLLIIRVWTNKQNYFRLYK